LTRFAAHGGASKLSRRALQSKQERASKAIQFEFQLMAFAMVEQQRFLFQVLRLQRPNEWSESLAKEGMRRKIERSALFSEHIGKLSP
jgi:hypothetical protein